MKRTVRRSDSGINKMSNKNILPEPMMNRQYETHLAAEGIEPFYLPAERRAIAFGSLAFLAATGKVVIDILKEASSE